MVYYCFTSITVYWLVFYIPTLIINQEGVDRSHSYIIYQTRMDSSKHGTNPTLGAQNVGLNDSGRGLCMVLATKRIWTSSANMVFGWSNVNWDLAAKFVWPDPQDMRTFINNQPWWRYPLANKQFDPENSQCLMVSLVFQARWLPGSNC